MLRAKRMNRFWGANRSILALRMLDTLPPLAAADVELEKMDEREQETGGDKAEQD